MSSPWRGCAISGASTVTRKAEIEKLMGRLHRIMLILIMGMDLEFGRVYHLEGLRLLSTAITVSMGEIWKLVCRLHSILVVRISQRLEENIFLSMNG